MGQYWLAVNLDKREFVDPHKLGDGLKLWEQIANGWTAKAVLVLCASMPERRGGGDLEPNPTIGRWAGDRIAWIGDYAEEGDLSLGCGDPSQIYSMCREGVYTDVSEDACEVLEKELDIKFEGSGWRKVREVA